MSIQYADGEVRTGSALKRVWLLYENKTPHVQIFPAG